MSAAGCRPHVCQRRNVYSQVTWVLLPWVLPRGGSLLLTAARECPSTSWYVAVSLSVPSGHVSQALRNEVVLELSVFWGAVR